MKYAIDGIQKPIFSKRLSNGTTTNMAINGSVTNQVFKIKPPSTEIWRVQQWLLYLEDEKGFNVTSYGANGVLTNGLYVSGVFGGDEIPLLEFPIKTNSDIISVTYDMNLHTWGNDNDVLVARWNFMNSGQSVRLDGSQGDELRITVRDDLTFLAKQYITAQGYIEA